MHRATLVPVAALAFVAGVVFSPNGWRDDCPTTLEIIRYLPLPEPQPIYPAPALIRVSDLPAPEREAEEPSVQQDDDPEPLHPRHHRHRRHWRRH